MIWATGISIRFGTGKSRDKCNVFDMSPGRTGGGVQLIDALRKDADIISGLYPWALKRASLCEFQLQPDGDAFRSISVAVRSTDASRSNSDISLTSHRADIARPPTAMVVLTMRNVSPLQTK